MRHFLWLALVCAPLSAAASQVSLAGSVSLTTPYVWRGLTRANGWNFQPELFLAAKIARGYLTVGGWANVEAGPDSPGNLSDLGSERPGISEVDYWIQYGRALGEIEVTAGAIRYTFPGDGPSAARTSDDNTSEIYGAIQLSSTYLVPRLAAYLDMDRVSGLYMEGGVTVPLLAYPFGNPIVFYASGLAGYNLGQEQNPDRPEQHANFRRSGFTHFDLSLRTTIRPLRSFPLSINLEPHFQFKMDEFTKRTSPEPGDADRSLQFWLGVSLSTAISP